ncbi:toprim domain-containing protein [Novipirellula artificiosorum]|uniref:Zinc-binding domain of primase-helicase n=1 Tax=Novipirellula artificiosorum TaxID=2528016 RepID=A0A5C6DK88_9BACT|nr:hypothetical protein [Novipirellula artificiosorum]TWU36021.1 hypothetical protein Poly41_37740 [Novipirellula artificiosorum]
MPQKPKKSIDFTAIKQAAEGRWGDIISALTPLPRDVLTKRGDDHPCPVCDGKTVIWPADDAETTGSIACRNCTGNKPTGDGIGTVAAFNGITQGEAAKLVAGYLGIAGEQSNPPERDIIAEVCRDKRMPIDAFKQFNPTIEKRGRNKNPVARVPVYNESGVVHSYYDFAPGHKGWFARGGGMAGMFFPGRLPKPGETWHIVEGCKDAAALIGLGFNAAGLPTSFLADKYAQLFQGVNVVIVPDLDNAGQNGAQRTGGNLKGIAASVRIARLPGEMVEKHGEDVRDVLRRTGGDKSVRDAIAAAEPWAPRDGEHDPKDGRPEVLVTLNYGWCVDQVTTTLGKLGWSTPWIPQTKRERLKLYQRCGVLVHVVTEDDPTEISGHVTMPAGTPRIRPLPMGQLPLRIADACQLVVEKVTDEGIEIAATPPPRWLIEGVFTRGEYGRDVPTLTGIIAAPTLRADGTILQATGYDAKTGLLHVPGDKFEKVPEKPSQTDAQRAAKELLEVVADFEWCDDADKSAWLALVLSQIGRSAISGCVPMFAITATTRGSGKSLLSDASSVIAFGRPAARKPYSRDDEEQRKAITATAIEALQAVLLDNVDKELGGAALDAALTATTWSDRVLGSSKTTGDLPLRTIWSATGNNLRFGTDLARRVLPIRLQPTVENPEERTDFEHADLLGWVRENRPRLAVAALTILRAYFVAGRPQQPGGAWGSYEAWSALVRGAIVWTGLADPLATRETAKADDSSGSIVRGLVGGLLEVDQHGDGMTVREIVKELNRDDNADRFPTLRDAVAEVATTRGTIDQRRLGYALRKYRGRIANGWQIVAESGHGGILRWLAKPVRTENGCDGGDGGDKNPRPYVREVCVSHPHTHSTHKEHTHGSVGNSGETCQPSQPSPPSSKNPLPCPRCGGDMEPAEIVVNGYRNYDCTTPSCGHVKPVKVQAEGQEAKA